MGFGTIVMMILKTNFSYELKFLGIKMAILSINLLFFKENNLETLYFSGLEKLLLL